MVQQMQYLIISSVLAYSTSPVESSHLSKRDYSPPKPEHVIEPKHEVEPVKPKPEPEAEKEKPKPEHVAEKPKKEPKLDPVHVAEEPKKEPIAEPEKVQPIATPEASQAAAPDNASQYTPAPVVPDSPDAYTTQAASYSSAGQLMISTAVTGALFFQ